MRRQIGMACLLVTAAVLVPGDSTRAESPVEHWHQRLTTAWNDARQQQRPMLLYLTINGCVHCGRLEQDTFANPGVTSEIREHYVAAKINAADEPVFVRKLGVRVFPTTVLVSPEARVIDSVAGYVPAAEMRTRLIAAARLAAAGSRARNAE